MSSALRDIHQVVLGELFFNLSIYLKTNKDRAIKNLSL
jgi:hypothetical protein